MDDLSASIKVKHLVSFLLIHGSTIIVLAFYIGVAFNRLANNEQVSHDNAVIIRALQETGTPYNHYEAEILKERYLEVIRRLERIEKQSR